MKAWLRHGLLAAFVFAQSGCGSSSGATVDVVFTPTGLTALNNHVNSGGFARFINDDTIQHQVQSPENLCPELNGPVITQGQWFSVTLANVNKTCLFRDALAPANIRFHGILIIGAGGTATSTIGQP